MTGWVFAILCLVCAAVLAVLIRKTDAAKRTEVEELKRQLAVLGAEKTAAEERFDAEKAALQSRFDAEKKLTEERFASELKLQADAHQRELAAKLEAFAEERRTAEANKAELKANFEAEKKRMAEHFAAELKLQADAHQRELAAKLEAFAEERRAAEASKAELKANFERTAAEMEKRHEERQKLMREEFQALSNKILEEKSTKLHSENKEQLEALLAPVKEKFTEFKTAVEESRTKGVALNAALTAQLEKMVAETARIGGEARDLTHALRGEQKMQGDWGELILEEILQRSGLQRGVHYECQETLRDSAGHTIVNEESAQKMRPDVVVHYPDNKDVVIDSKVSLTAYADYMNAEDDASRAEALTRHLASVRTHIDELVRKDYSEYIKKSGRDSVDFVIMFIPNEGSFQLAMISDPTLWNNAFKQKVLIVSGANLMALLKIIHIAWTRDEQDRNQQEILKAGTQLLDRLYAFYEEFDAVGTALAKVSNTYENALHRLKIGARTQSVVAAGEKLKKLGLKLTRKRELPESLQSELELDSGDEAVTGENNLQTSTN